MDKRKRTMRVKKTANMLKKIRSNRAYWSISPVNYVT